MQPSASGVPKINIPTPGSNLPPLTVNYNTSIPQPTYAAPTVNIIQDTPHSVFQSLAHLWNGTQDQVRDIVNLRYSSDNKEIINLSRKDIMMEIVGMLRKNGFQHTYDFLSQATNPEFVLWEQESMDEGRARVISETEMEQIGESGVKGVGTCRYCASTELIISRKQTRSGDEGMTIFVRCVMCQRQWRE